VTGSTFENSACSSELSHDDPTAVGLPVGGVAFVFWQQPLGAAVFIGESDRLSSYLSMWLAEYDVLRTYLRVPAWNATMFAGFFPQYSRRLLR
jgi:hypothetical protein